MDKTGFPLRGDMEMEIRKLDLYRAVDMEAPEGAAAELWCYIQHTSGEVTRSRRRPAVLILPGGGYGYVSEREAEPVALRFAARGWSTFVLMYSVAPNKFPTALREAAMAMAYIRRNAGEMEIDPAMVAAIGFSAGGHLCGTLGTLFDSPEVEDIGPAELLRPDALGLCYPVVLSLGRTHNGSFRKLCGEDMQLRQRLSLDGLVRPDMPPVFLWHLRDDDSVPVCGSLILAQRLEEAGVDFAMHIYRQGGHGLSTADAQVYPMDARPTVSWDVPGWLEAQIRYFEEIGMKPRDTEV